MKYHKTATQHYWQLIPVLMTIDGAIKVETPKDMPKNPLCKPTSKDPPKPHPKLNPVVFSCATNVEMFLKLENCEFTDFYIFTWCAHSNKAFKKIPVLPVASGKEVGMGGCGLWKKILFLFHDITCSIAQQLIKNKLTRWIVGHEN